MAKKWDNNELFRTVVVEGKNRSIFVTAMISDNEPRVDVRAHYLDEDDNWAPTQKGVRLHAEMVPGLITALQEALDKVDEELAPKKKGCQALASR